jgi:hypothetical protein
MLPTERGTRVIFPPARDVQPANSSGLRRLVARHRIDDRPESKPGIPSIKMRLLGMSAVVVCLDG